jgi:hypothetical protein
MKTHSYPVISISNKVHAFDGAIVAVSPSRSDKVLFRGQAARTTKVMLPVKKKSARLTRLISRVVDAALSLGFCDPWYYNQDKARKPTHSVRPLDLTYLTRYNM